MKLLVNYWKNKINRLIPARPVIKPVYTCKGLCEFSFNLDARTSPEITNEVIKNHPGETDILNDRASMVPVRAPAAAA